MRGGKLQLRCQLFVKKAGKATHAGGKRKARAFPFQRISDANVDCVKVSEWGKDLENYF